MEKLKLKDLIDSAINKLQEEKYSKDTIDDYRFVWNKFYNMCELFNVNYFDVIDTEEKAYWLGFIMADGAIVSTGKKYKKYTISYKYDENGNNIYIESAGSICSKTIKEFDENNRQKVAKVSKSYLKLPKNFLAF